MRSRTTTVAGRAATVEPLATKNPANNTQMPTNNVVANAVSSPSRPASEPLADKMTDPPAMSTLPSASRPGADTIRRADVVTEGDRRRRTCIALYAAPRKMTIAGSAEPTAASIRGRVVNTSDPLGSSSPLTGDIGATITTPRANPLKMSNTRAVTSPMRVPASK